MRVVSEFPHPVREIEHVDVPMSDGCRLAARILAARRRQACAGPSDPRIHPLPQERSVRARGPNDRPVPGRARLRLCPARPARGRRQRGSHDRRVPAAGARGRLRGHRLACRSALVRRPGRHGGHLLGRLQRPADRGNAAAGAQGGDHGLLERRPVRRRHPLHGRLPAARSPILGEPDVRAEHAAARSAAPQRLAQAVARAAGKQRALAEELAGASAARRVLATWLGLRGLFQAAGADLRCWRLGRRLLPRGLQAYGKLERSASRPDRALGPQISSLRQAGSRHRLYAGVAALVGSMAART